MVQEVRGCAAREDRVRWQHRPQRRDEVQLDGGGVARGRGGPARLGLSSVGEGSD